MGKIINGECLEELKKLEEGSIHCCITSPPYYGLRNYANERQIGVEASPYAYIDKLVEVFGEVRRVLRKDGTFWLNIGDSYAGSNGNGWKQTLAKTNGAYASKENYSMRDKFKRNDEGFKSKDLMMMPARLAIALQESGWYLRQDIIWHKPAPMPESVLDRCTRAHEYVFLLSKSAKYFYDADAISEPMETEPHAPGNKKVDASRNDKDQMQAVWGMDGTRNKRSVWSINTSSFTGAHFATFPEELVSPMIMAGTSERGCCSNCGAPWIRIVERKKAESKSCPKEKAAHEARGGRGEHTGTVGKSGGGRVEGFTKTIGWEPSCNCNYAHPDSPCAKDDQAQVPYPTVPCVVLDPFFGSGTVGLVAKSLDRDYVGIELNPEYVKIAEKRIGTWLF